ncbi:MAG: 50S ribosomal protein L4 [Endomicrobiales bacterium]|nr:50S ribosomal protein L4 [Endomicrobiales bacterium]
METTVLNTKGKEAGKVALPPVFETKISSALLHEVVTGYLANQRSGTHSTKTRAEVSGSGRKPWRQKGTGNARVGSIRSPLWRKGGITFGPKPRSYYQNIPQQKKRNALHMALASKASEGGLVVIEDFKIEGPKTKMVADILDNLNLGEETVLLVVNKIEENLKKASRNIENLFVSETNNLNAYEVLWAKKVMFAKSALDGIK